MRECEQCGAGIVRKNAQARYCSTKCRVRAHRNPLPPELTSRDRWVRWKIEIRKGKPTKAPIQIDGSYASSTNPDTWTSHATAKASVIGKGLGFVLGNGIACIDIDHCITDGTIDPRALELMASTEHFYAEISPSGDGIHIWHHADESAGTRKIENGLHVERYSTGRYITVTGRKL